MSTVSIPLTRGKFAIVDASDAELVAGTWQAVQCGTKWYAGRTVRISPTKCIRVYMHRLIANAPKGVLVDHRDRDTLNNRRVNLRLANKSGNAANSRKRPGLSVYRGVTPTPEGRWIGQIRANGKALNLGSYESEVEAACAYNAAAKAMHGEFASLNKIEGLTDDEACIAPIRNRRRGRLPKRAG